MLFRSAPKGTSSPYDTHKKSELRGVYNSIVKMNKESPLYLLKTDEATGEFAVGMKENARELKNIIASLSSGGTSDILDKKAVASGNADVVTATYISNADEGEEIPSLEIEVKSLAQNQVNEGTYLPQSEIALEPNT